MQFGYDVNGSRLVLQFVGVDAEECEIFAAFLEKLKRGSTPGVSIVESDGYEDERGVVHEGLQMFIEVTPPYAKSKVEAAMEEEADGVEAV